MNSKLFAILTLFFCINFSILESKDLDSFEYIYVNSNSGQSSGGHSAIKFGDWVYHFQYYPDKIFHLVRDPWFDFRYTYNVMENRTLYLTKIKPSKPSTLKLERGFNRFYIVQEKHLTNIRLLKRELEFQKLLNSHKLENFKIKSIGYFSEKETNPKAYDSLISEIETRFGKNFLIEMQNQIYQEFLKIKEENLNYKKERINTEEFYALPELFHEKYERTIQKIILLSVLNSNSKLKESSILHIPTDKKLNLSYIERNLYKFFLKSIEQRIIYQIDSRNDNPNWAQDCLISVATYLAIEESLVKNEFIFLDTLPNDDEHVNWNMDNQSLKLAKDSFPIFTKYRKEFFQESQEIHMQDFVDLQDSANRWIEIYKASRINRPIRNTQNRTLPYKEAESWVSIPIAYQILKATNTSYQQLEEDLNNYSVRLQEIYPYHLIFKNCTSEIFVKISEIYSHNSDKIKEDLGKNIDPLNSLSFIPFYSSFDVRNNYKSIAKSEIPSYRILYVDQRVKKENKWWIPFQEDFTASSTIYKTNTNDHLFLFFTDDTIVLRPIYGIANLGTAVGQTLFGIPLIIVDKGDQFKKGLDGILFSMPELIFFNIRKGSFYQTTISELEPNFPDYKMEPFHE